MGSADEDSVWQAFKNRRDVMKDRKAQSRVTSPLMLKEAGIVFDQKSDTHFKVFGHGLVVDFWPGTGLWIDPKNNVRKRGVKPLIAYIQKSLNESKQL